MDFLSFNHEQLWLGGRLGTCICAASDDIICSLEAFFPTRRLVLKSLFAALDSRSHKPLTSSGPGVRSAWVLNRGISAQDLQKSGSTSASKGGGLGEQGPPCLELGRGIRKEAQYQEVWRGRR